MIFWHMDDHGGFTAGDTETGLTSYAYPSSPNAGEARRNPASVARRMLAVEPGLWRTTTSAAEYDCRNWARLGVLVAA